MSLPRRLHQLGHMILEGGQEEDERHQDLLSNDLGVYDGNEPDPGYLHLGAQSKTAYISPSHFASIRQEISEINNLLRQQKGYTVQDVTPNRINSANSTSQSGDPTGSRSHRPTSSFSHGLDSGVFANACSQPWTGVNMPIADESISRANLIDAIPPSEACEELLWAYFRGYHTMRPLFNGLSFLEEVQAFQLWREGANPDYILGPHFLALYMAVIFASCCVSPRAMLQRHFGPSPRERLAQQYYDLAVSAIRLAEFPASPSLRTFAAYIIIDSTWLREEQPLQCCSLVGLGFRVAQMLGLHREPSRLEGVKAVDVQVRRHLWWTIVALDAQVALASGLPPMIESKLYQVNAIDERDEVDVASYQQGGQPPGRKTILGIFVGGRYAFYHHTSTFLRLINNYQVTEADVDKTLQITHEIHRQMEDHKKHILDLSRTLQTPEHQPPSTPPSAPSHQQLHRAQSNRLLALFAIRVLTMLAAKPYAIMYGPLRKHNLLGYLQQKEPEAINRIRLFLHSFLQLAQDQRFQPWHWCWPGQHQPLHSILALITELEEHPDGTWARDTRRADDLSFGSDHWLSELEQEGDAGRGAQVEGIVPLDFDFLPPTTATSVEDRSVNTHSDFLLDSPNWPEPMFPPDIMDPNWAAGFLDGMPFEDPSGYDHVFPS
ncbi:hypothetical protein D0862_11862 [Hortaea werneckii]|uniref:Xylanolytic transcriptional activator regulatory domain-containing protein n=1 Tax=Hortaea werneckii TaxID=91943 RepID=A0A3M7F226_HORWE|nr:hypothetical protein D0862_11862 [Hortaea werneckii]